jgi:hypothetical protein
VPDYTHGLYEIDNIITSIGGEYNERIDALLDDGLHLLVRSIPITERKAVALALVERLMNKVEAAGLGPE